MSGVSILTVLAPLLFLQLILVVVALIDLGRREAAAVNGPKWVWALLILFTSLLGPILYFVIGRKNT
jgi:hypothetical protein